MSKAQDLSSLKALPDWVPAKVINYLRHTEAGQSLRDVARMAGVNASTILRQVRHYESRRDDPLMDEALRALALRHHRLTKESAELPIESEGSRILAKLAEKGSVMVLASDMEKAIVMRELPSGRSQRTAVFTREIAQALILKDWIACKRSGKLSLYEITPKGRQMVAQLSATPLDTKEEGLDFSTSAVLWQQPERVALLPRRIRLSQSDTPLQILGRRRDKRGKPFLSLDLMRAADWLREDFELAEVDLSLERSWEAALSGQLFEWDSEGTDEGKRRALERLRAALAALGPELATIVLRICCYSDGIEEAEQRMGWAARSGKIVLRIALQRLRRHYEEAYGPSGPMIG